MSENRPEKKYTAMELILAICILFLPLMVINIFAIAILIIIVIFLLSFLSLAVVGLGELIAGVAMVGVGIEKLFSMPMGAVAIMGFGVCNIGVALLLECFVFWLYGVAIPHLVRKITGREVGNEKMSEISV